MIPDYPSFKLLELSDKSVIESFTNKYRPYSDFNFVSLWSYNIHNKVRIASISENLVILFEDYISGDLFYSILGDFNIQKSVEVLLDSAKEQKYLPYLKLVPEETVQKLLSSLETQTVQCIEDRDNDDYILDIENLIKLSGDEYRAKRNFINRFINHFGEKTNVQILDLHDSLIQSNILNLFYIWEENHHIKRTDSQNELQALNNLLSAVKNFDQLFPIGIFINEKLCAFSITEILQNGYSTIHFEKADIQYVGIYPYLKQQLATLLSKKGISYINYEQDLGLEGLRKAKLAYHPSFYLKKYIIKR